MKTKILFTKFIERFKICSSVSICLQSKFVNKQFEILLKKESGLLNSKRGKSVETSLLLQVSKALDEIFMAVNAAMFYDKSCTRVAERSARLHRE